MLSVLIPVYNYNAQPLVLNLMQELEFLQIPFEILCFDDASTITFQENKKLNKLAKVHYHFLDENIGRSRIRNKMAAIAKYDWLLFLDADVLPVNREFISLYLNFIKGNHSVICGGIDYRKSDRNKSNSLRYLYGTKVEAKSAATRAMKPYKWFSTANVLLAKSVFSSVQFYEELQTYGMEDTLFSVELRKNKLEPVHINNPVWHLGLEDNTVYLNKTKEAIANLYFLYKKSLISPTDSRLLKTALLLKKRKLAKTFDRLFNARKEAIEKNLLSEKPKLYLFNYYRLGLLNSLFLCGYYE
ncbi:MAG: glycosyl transferase [Flavobacteriales bacterium]|nr:MAG: glycosyl transferase [Flavobacteriales bacterium]